MADEITQTPFQPLIAEDDGSGLEAMFGKEYVPSPSAMNKARMADVAFSMQKLSQQQTGFMPTFLATAAALTGNFGPAIQLQEQKRRTQIGMTTLPYIGKINELMNSGQWEDAAAMVETVGSAIGPRAPEMVPFFQQMMTKIGDRQKHFTNLKSVYESAKVRIGDNAPESQKKLLQALGNLVKNRDYISETTLNNMLTGSQLHTQVIGNRVIQSSQFGGDVDVRPAPTMVEGSETQDAVGNFVANAHGIGTNQLTNVLNGLPIKTADGVTIDPGSAKAREIQKDYYASLGARGELEAAKLIPVEPIISTQMLAGGADPLAIARRKLTGGQVSNALTQHYDRLIEQAKAPILAGLDLDVRIPAQADYVAINVDPSSSDFLNNAGPMSIGTYNSLGGRAKFIPKDEAKNVQGLRKSIEGMNYINQMVANYGDASTPLDRIETGINRLVTRYLGVAATPNMPMGKAAEAIVNQSIEDMEKTKTLPSGVIAELKQLMLGPFANNDSSLRAALFVQQRIKEELKRIVGTKVVDDRDAFESIQKQQGSSTPTPKGGTPENLPPDLKKIKKNYQQRLQDLQVK